MLSASQLSGENFEAFHSPTRPISQSIAIQTEVAPPLSVAAEVQPPSEPKKEVVTYSKGVQADFKPPHTDSSDDSAESEDDGFPHTPRLGKRVSKKDRELQEEIRRKLRTEIEEEMQASQQQQQQHDEDQLAAESMQRYPLRTLSEDELKAVTSSDDFFDFVERSTKVIERALDEDYDVLADYELGGVDGDMDEDEGYGKKKRGIREVCQFWDERWSKKRMISDLSFSPKVVIDMSNAGGLLLLTVIVFSSQNLCSHLIPRTLPHRMSPTVLYSSGTNTCTLVQNTSSTQPPISLQQNSRHFTLTSSWVVLILGKFCCGTRARLVQAAVLPYKRHP